MLVQQERTEGTREDFIHDCQSGKYDNVVAIYRTFDSVQVTGRLDAELVPQLPQSLRFVAHNGAGYDQIDADVCAARGSRLFPFSLLLAKAEASRVFLDFPSPQRRV